MGERLGAGRVGISLAGVEGEKQGGVCLYYCVGAKMGVTQGKRDEGEEQEAGRESILKEGLGATEARQACGTGAKLVWLNCRQKGHGLQRDRRHQRSICPKVLF